MENKRDWAEIGWSALAASVFTALTIDVLQDNEVDLCGYVEPGLRSGDAATGAAAGFASMATYFWMRVSSEFDKGDK
jgi:hypothetical protein